MSYNTQFPTLSSFLIFTTQPIMQQQSNTSDPDALPPSVLYFFHSNPTLSPDKRDRLIGLTQGLLNFTAVLSHDLHPAQSTHPGLRVIHSANQKMIFLHPEPGFHLCAVIKLPQSGSNEPAQGPSKLPNTLNILSQHPAPQSSYQPSETVLLNSLYLASQEYRLLNGSLTSIHSKDRKLLVKQLERFWSVWLWRWNVGKTGCGAIDFNEFFGHLESPFLEPPRPPKRTLESFNQFINRVCPKFQALPILIYNHNVLHLPSPTEFVKQEEIQTLARYLLSLLGGSEAKPISKPSSSGVNKDQDNNEKKNYMKNLSGFTLNTMNTMLNFPPKLRSISQSFDSKSSWAHKALSWASTSLVLPPNASDSSSADVDTLDQQLRADLGLLTSTPPKVVSIKSVPSNPQLFTDSVPSPTPLTFKASRLRYFRQIYRDNLTGQFGQLPTKNYHTVGYPENLLQIYPPQKINAAPLYYPENLKNLYNNNPSEEYQSNSSDSLYQQTSSLGRRIAESSRRTISEGETQILKASPSLSSTNSKHTPPSSSIDSRHNPRSSEFNVEYALADAMSENSIGNIASLEAVPHKQQPFQEFLAATTNLSHFLLNKASGSNLRGDGPTLLTPPASTNQSTIKRIKIYVNEGQFETDVIWIREDDWNMALIMDHFNHHDIQQNEKDEPYDLIVEHIKLVLKSFVESGWLPRDELLEQESKTTLPLLKHPSSPSINPRYLIRNVQTGIFYKLSNNKSSWLLKNQIWPGKIVHPFEVEISHAILSLFSNSHSNSEVLNRSNGVGRGDKNVDGTIKEGFLRTNSGQWVIFKKIHHHHHHRLVLEEETDNRSGEFELFVVLPSGSGTLIEADNALRLLEQH